ncbi:AraC family transcriptional regulator [Leucobacter sp. HY1910]
MHHIDDAAQIGLDLAVETISDSDTVRFAHRHAFAQFVLIDNGAGEHVIDGVAYRVHPGYVHVVAPGQVHLWRNTQSLSARALMFSEEFLDPSGPLPPKLRELLLFGQAPERPTPASLRALRSLLAALEAAVGIESRRHLALAFLWELAQAPLRIAHTSTQVTLVQQFQGIAMRAPNARTSVATCALKLGVTPGHLSEQVVAETGSTPGQILRQAVTREAQRLLRGTDLSAAQIAAMLGFNEPSYFSRFFRREVGFTPSEFRSDAHFAHHEQAAS